jgi:hypothetical protein
VLSGEVAAPDDVKYRFRFLHAAATIFPWMKFKDLIFTTKRKREVIDDLKVAAGRPLTEMELNKLDDHLDLVDRTFKMDEAVTYQELDSIDNPNLYTDDDVVEVFIRANSGGTKLSKSDLLFSLLAASWEVADEKMDDLLDSLNQHGFGFDRDFVLKTCLVLLKEGARYEVQKFRKPGVREAIEERWEDISAAIQAVLDFVRQRTFIQCDKALSSYLALIPLIYIRYHEPMAWKITQNVDSYLLRCLLAGAFSGQSDNLLDGLVQQLEERREFIIDDIFGVIRSQGRSLELTEERFWNMGYCSDTIHLLFNIWYRDFNYTPAYDNNLPQIDHIFPESALKSVRIQNPATGRMVMKYTNAERNQLANCMLLSREENGAGEKWDTVPEEWFLDKGKDYLDKHLIPDDPALWKLDRFEDFIDVRKMLVRDRFKTILLPPINTRT